MLTPLKAEDASPLSEPSLYIMFYNPAYLIACDLVYIEPKIKPSFVVPNSILNKIWGSYTDITYSTLTVTVGDGLQKQQPDLYFELIRAMSMWGLFRHDNPLLFINRLAEIVHHKESKYYVYTVGISDIDSEYNVAKGQMLYTIKWRCIRLNESNFKNAKDAPTLSLDYVRSLLHEESKPIVLYQR